MHALTRKATRYLLPVAVLVLASELSQAGDKVKLDVPALAKAIDQAVDQRLKAEQVKPSLQADDAEFLRRVYLDIIGVIPTADKAAAFLDSKKANKRPEVIDELLADANYGRQMADISRKASYWRWTGPSGSRKKRASVVNPLRVVASIQWRCYPKRPQLASS